MEIKKPVKVEKALGNMHEAKNQRSWDFPRNLQFKKKSHISSPKCSSNTLKSGSLFSTVNLFKRRWLTQGRKQ